MLSTRVSLISYCCSDSALIFVYFGEKNHAHKKYATSGSVSFVPEQVMHLHTYSLAKLLTFLFDGEETGGLTTTVEPFNWTL